MNSNQFLLPQSQARHLQRRNLTAMQRQTLTLGHEAAEMEDKLQLLKNRMSQEKEERSRSAKFRWKSEQPGSSDSSALDATGKKKKAGGPHTLPGRTLSSRAPQRQPLTGPCFPVPVPPAEPPRAAQAGRRSRRRGRGCGQAAALIPDPASQDSEVELLEEDPHRPGEGWPPGLLPGGSEQEPSLLDPLPRWRADAAGGLERTAQAVLWTPGSPVSAAAAATQADLSPTGGGGGGQGRALLRVEFTETSLSYLDRLLLKTHRRTSILTGPGLEEQTEPHSGEQNPTRRDSPTEEDLEHLHLCCSLLLAVTTTGGSSEPPVAPLEPCLTIQVLDETFREPEEDLVASQARSKSRKVLHQRALGPKRAPEPSSAAPNLQSSKTPAGQKSSRSRKASSRRVVQGPKSPRTSSLHTEHSPCSSGTSSQAELSAAPCPSPCPCPSSCPVPAELLSQSPASTAEPTSPPPRLVPSPLSFPSPVSTSEDALVESLCSVSLGDHFPPDEDRRQWPQPTHEALPGLLRETGNPQAERTDEEDHLESDGEDVSVDSLEEDMLHGDRRQMPTGKEVMEGRQAEGWEGGREGGQAHLSTLLAAGGASRRCSEMFSAAPASSRSAP